MPTYPQPMYNQCGIFSGLWFCLQDGLHDWAATMHLVKAHGGKTTPDPWHTQLTHMVVDVPRGTGKDYTHVITEYSTFSPRQETHDERRAWPLDRIVDVFTQGRFRRGVAVVQKSWITECLAMRRQLGANDGYGGWLVRGVRLQHGFEREWERYTEEIQMASYFDDDNDEDDGGYYGRRPPPPPPPRRIEAKGDPDEGRDYRLQRDRKRERERQAERDRDRDREFARERGRQYDSRREDHDERYYRDAARDPRLRTSSDCPIRNKRDRGSWSPELSSPSGKRRATTAAPSSAHRDDDFSDNSAQCYEQDHYRRKPVIDLRGIRPTWDEYNRGERPQVKVEPITPARDRLARSVSRLHSRRASIELSPPPPAPVPTTPQDPRSAYGTVGRGRPSAPPSWLPTFTSTAPSSRQDTMVVHGSRSVSAYQPRTATTTPTATAVPSRRVSAYQPRSNTTVVAREKENLKTQPQPQLQPTRTFTRASTVEVKREPEDVAMPENLSQAPASTPNALDELCRVLMQEMNGGYQSGDVAMAPPAVTVSSSVASPLFTPDPSPPPEEPSTESRSTISTACPEERPAGATAPIVIDKTNESAPPGIFGAGRRFPVTFWVWPSHPMIETMIGMSGGVLVERSEAEFVVLPVDQGDTVTEAKMAELVRGVGLHPLGRVVSRDWVWRSVNNGALQSLAPFLLAPNRIANGTGAPKATANRFGKSTANRCSEPKAPSNSSGKRMAATATATHHPMPGPHSALPSVLAPPQRRASVTTTTTLGEYNFVDDAEPGSDPDDYGAAQDDDSDDSVYTPTTSAAATATGTAFKKASSTRSSGANPGNLTPPADLMPVIDRLVDWMSKWDQVGGKMTRIYAFGKANGYKEKKIRSIYLDYKLHINSRVPILVRHSRREHRKHGMERMTR